MKILIGPDSLKDSVSASDFCHVAKKVIKRNWPNTEVIAIPLADGGEGTVDALVAGSSGKYIKKAVTDPLGHTIDARYGLIKNNTTAVIEMAAASGLPLVPVAQRNPMKTTTYGTGELILDAINRGCKKIIIGIGGSATNDAGLGMMQALGYKCLDLRGNDIPYGGDGLLKLAKIIPPEKNIFQSIQVQVACDVNNPLYGSNGAAHVYGKQKGADNKMITILDEGLKNFSKVVLETFGKPIDKLPGGGAAGGLGAGLSLALNAQLLPGFEIIRNIVDLDHIFQGHIDLVITAEGQMNHQSLNGKLPVELAKLANSYGTKTIAIVGSRDIDMADLSDTGIIGVFPIVNGPMSLDESMANGKALIQDTLLQIMSLVMGLKK